MNQKIKKYNKKHIGEQFITNEGYRAVIIDGGTKPGYCTIRIEDWIVEINYCSIKKCSVKYPYHKSVCGVGFIGEGTYSYRNNMKLYKIWFAMIQRCYSIKQQKIQPTYKDVKVDNDWMNLQQFGIWYDNNYIDGYQLDKDLLSTASKLYSPNTCLFIPHELNLFLTNIKSSNTSGYTGACFDKSSGKWASSINISGKKKHLGLFSSKEKASEIYIEARRAQAEIMKEIYKNELPKEAINNIM